MPVKIFGHRTEKTVQLSQQTKEQHFAKEHLASRCSKTLQDIDKHLKLRLMLYGKTKWANCNFFWNKNTLNPLLAIVDFLYI